MTAVHTEPSPVPTRIVVQQFRTLPLSIIAMSGIVTALLWLGWQAVMFIRNTESHVAFSRIADFWLTISWVILLASSLCALSLRPWTRWGLVIYGALALPCYGTLVFKAADESNWGTLGLILGKVPRGTGGETLFFVLAGLAVLHAIATLVVMFLPNTRKAYGKGREYAHLAYVSEQDVRLGVGAI